MPKILSFTLRENLIHLIFWTKPECDNHDFLAHFLWVAYQINNDDDQNTEISL